MKLILEDDKERYTAEFDYVDVTVDDLLQAFTGLLIANAYQIESIEDAILDLAETIKRRDDENLNTTFLLRNHAQEALSSDNRTERKEKQSLEAVNAKTTEKSCKEEEKCECGMWNGICKPIKDKE